MRTLAELGEALPILVVAMREELDFQHGGD